MTTTRPSSPGKRKHKKSDANSSSSQSSGFIDQRKLVRSSSARSFKDSVVPISSEGDLTGKNSARKRPRSSTLEHRRPVSRKSPARRLDSRKNASKSFNKSLPTPVPEKEVKPRRGRKRNGSRRSRSQSSMQSKKLRRRRSKGSRKARSISARSISGRSSIRSLKGTGLPSDLKFLPNHKLRKVVIQSYFFQAAAAKNARSIPSRSGSKKGLKGEIKKTEKVKSEDGETSRKTN